ncbi:hypothetical protein BpHYR1_053510 [Brachionus plicatilis]|uniref:Uncharacterized protein n=1 Tax=Brachionus plicatilis TaxID=10195 RepID=A0A3M7S776_BRAPC|nr:hypothetical protein BpHYR1_053510 [Brachionus plicatilis]
MEFIFSNVILDYAHIKIESKECSIIDSNEVCPHTTVNVTRQNRFPFKVTYSICNCDNCLYIKNCRCVPIMIKRPVLYRTICNSDNYWDWKFGFEKIPIQCNCIKKSV